jgi:hypothetical protein
MSLIAARWVVTHEVPDGGRQRLTRMGETPRETMSEHVLTVDSDVPVTIAIESSRPFKAAVGHPDEFGCKTVGGRGNWRDLSTSAHLVVIAAAYGAGVDTASAAFDGTSGSLHD